jgi:probable rRNA maturation factor
MLGEVYLCLPLVRRRARRLGLDGRSWVAELAVHGLLHLMGFEHGDPAAARRMATVQRGIMHVVRIR